MERKKINRLFNYFLPIDTCCCGCSLDFAFQAIISLQTISTFFYLIEVIANGYLPGIIFGTGSAILVYNGIQGLHKKKNFVIYFWIMKISFFIEIILLIFLFLFCILMLFGLKVYLKEPESMIGVLLILFAAFILEFLIQLYLMILIHSYYVKNYDNEQIDPQAMNSQLYINQNPLLYHQQMQTNLPLSLPNQPNFQATYIAHESLNTSTETNQYPLALQQQLRELQGQTTMIMPLQNQQTDQYDRSQYAQQVKQV